MNIRVLEDREKPEKFIKYKQATENARHLTKSKKEKEYDYYKCDFCGEEIVIKKTRHEMDGGLIELSSLVTKKYNLRLALHNRCLKNVLKMFEKES